MQDFKQIVTTWLPPLAGIGLIALFVSLAAWQLERAAEKKEMSALFADAAPVAELDEISAPELFQPLTATGTYLPDRQVLIDNIIKNSQVGYYVITPFVAEPDGRLLLVNRGWVSKQAYGEDLPPVNVDGERRTLVARVGRLPRVALRPDAAFTDDSGWPRVAIYPNLADVEQALAREVSEPVLLLAPGMPDGYLRNWQPAEKGPMMHYGYAFQWSALALTVLVIMIWQFRKRTRNEH